MSHFWVRAESEERGRGILVSSALTLGAGRHPRCDDITFLTDVVEQTEREEISGGDRCLLNTPRRLARDRSPSRASLPYRTFSPGKSEFALDKLVFILLL
eukprot:COSAG02_NODE_30993_length_541_cov_0.995475_1_plen_100_part_00